ncbi:MAG: DMT family transporter [Rhodospirillales bacterium]|jgi:drug/metabolite transporter (DMT)-like permease|nr:DMT family transporter [Rhodospirillales bacterium]
MSSQSQRPPTRATAIGAIAILLWSALALLTTETNGIPAFELLTLGFGVAAAAGLILLALRGRAAVCRLRQPPRAWLLGFVGLFLYHALYFLSLKSAPAAQANLINYLWPLLIVLFAATLPGHRLRGRHLAGAGLGLAGTILLLRAPLAGTGEALPGYAAAAGAAVVWAGYSVLNRRLAEVPSEVIAGVCALVALAALACHLALERTVAPSAPQWAAIFALGLGPVGLAFYAWDHATKHGNLATLGSLSYATPLLSTALLIAAGRAPLSPALLGAAGLVIAGALVATGRFRGPASETASD